MQLNPVRNHSLMGAFGIDVPGVPLYEKMDPVQRQKSKSLMSTDTMCFGNL